jgi:hypothetical protein
MVVCFVENLGVSGKTQGNIDDFVGKLRSKGFELDIEGSFEQYLGIKFERNVRDGTVEMIHPKGTNYENYHDDGT